MRFVREKRLIYKQSKKNLTYSFVKALLDRLIGCLALIMLCPVLLIISITILIVDGKPLFYKQIRTGKNNKEFIMWKFRSMKSDSVKSKTSYMEDESWKSGVPESFVFKASSSSKVTKIGYFLRKYSLDELPQLINLVNGTMSLIGPRPEIPEITVYYNEIQRKRLNVTPGITGLAQINGRSDINHGKKIEYDLYYADNISLLLDFKILFKTFISVFSGKGSY